MREALLKVLAKAKPGIQINMYTNGVCTVETLYYPHVKGVGKSLGAAAQDCACWLLDVIKDYPSYREPLKEVLEAFDMYDREGRFPDA